MDRTIRITLLFESNSSDIFGRVVVIGDRGIVEIDECPAALDESEAREMLLSAVLDGRIKLPDDVAVALDLVGSNPRVR